MNTIDIVKNVAKILDDKKAIDITILKVKDITTVAEYFVIAEGTSNTHIRSLTDEIDVKLTEQGEVAHHKEGEQQAIWIVMDYSSVIVHIFCKEARNFYSLEKLWSEGIDVTKEILG